MADLEPPSFSLGLDDNQEEEFLVPREETLEPNFDLLREEEGGEEVDPPAVVLKRLRRGPSSPPRYRSNFEDNPTDQLLSDAIDEIEDFSSPEDRHKAQKHSICRDSKLSLPSQTVLTSQSKDGPSVKRSLSDFSFSFPKSEASTSKNVLPPTVTSPLRRIQLLDSDSDEPTANEDTREVYHGTDAGKAKEKVRSSQNSMGFQEKHISNEPSKGQKTLWKDFNEKKYVSLATPALDEFCEEYFASSNWKGVAQRKNAQGNDDVGSSISNQLEDAMDCLQETKNVDKVRFGDSRSGIPPSYHYFYHKDPRIQKLVYERLPNFHPLVYGSSGINESSRESSINYMSQFGQKGSQQKSVQVHKKSNNTPRATHESRVCVKSKNSSSVPRGISKRKATKDFHCDTEAWVNPKSSSSIPRGSRKRRATEGSRDTTFLVNAKNSTSIPRDAGKRRVQAAVQSSGHWYTGQDGRKVYVSKTGEQLTGNIAYRSYKKESGKGFKRKKQSATRKKCK